MVNSSQVNLRIEWSCRSDAAETTRSITSALDKITSTKINFLCSLRWSHILNAAPYFNRKYFDKQHKRNFVLTFCFGLATSDNAVFL